MQEPIQTLLKASEVARSFLSDVGNNVPFILASLAASLFLSFASADFLPDALAKFHGLFVALSFFLLFYFLLLWWSSRRQQLGAVEMTTFK